MTPSRFVTIAATVLFLVPGAALGASNAHATLGPSHETGQPNQSCETTGTTPGNAAAAPGSAFNPDGTAGTKYAGEQPQNSKNPVSVPQYDVACSKQPN